MRLTKLPSINEDANHMMRKENISWNDIDSMYRKDYRMYFRSTAWHIEHLYMSLSSPLRVDLFQSHISPFVSLYFEWYTALAVVSLSVKTEQNRTEHSSSQCEMGSRCFIPILSPRSSWCGFEEERNGMERVKEGGLAAREETGGDGRSNSTRRWVAFISLMCLFEHSQRLKR